MRLYSYVVARDYGFAPNPFYGLCTLATCKPKIRKVAAMGDWVVGTGSKATLSEGQLVFAMRVTETLSFNEYWENPRFSNKKPDMHSSLKRAFGDNIYFRDPDSNLWVQSDSHHSRDDGSENRNNVAHDTGVDRVLISDDFVYWGGAGPHLPESLKARVCAGRGHKSNFSDAEVGQIVRWIRSLEASGYREAPLEWN